MVKPVGRDISGGAWPSEVGDILNGPSPFAIGTDECVCIQDVEFYRITETRCITKADLFKERQIDPIVARLNNKIKFWEDYQPNGSELTDPTDLRDFVNPQKLTANNNDRSNDAPDAIDAPSVTENNLPDWPAVSEAVHAITGEVGDPRRIISSRLRSVLDRLNAGENFESLSQDLFQALALDTMAKMAIRARGVGELAEIGGETVSLRDFIWGFAEERHGPEETFAFLMDFGSAVNFVGVANAIDNKYPVVDNLVRALGSNAPASLIELRDTYAKARATLDKGDLIGAMKVLSQVPEISRMLEADLQMLKDRAEKQGEIQAMIAMGTIVLMLASFGVGEMAGAGVEGVLIGSGATSIRVAQVVGFLTSSTIMFGTFTLGEHYVFGVPWKEWYEYLEDYALMMATLGLIRGMKLGEVAAEDLPKAFGMTYAGFTAVDSLRLGVHGENPLGALGLNASLSRFAILASIALVARPLAPILRSLKMNGYKMGVKYRASQSASDEAVPAIGKLCLVSTPLIDGDVRAQALEPVEDFKMPFQRELAFSYEVVFDSDSINGDAATKEAAARERYYELRRQDPGREYARASRVGSDGQKKFYVFRGNDSDVPIGDNDLDAHNHPPDVDPKKEPLLGSVLDLGRNDYTEIWTEGPNGEDRVNIFTEIGGRYNEGPRSGYISHSTIIEWTPDGSSIESVRHSIIITETAGFVRLKSGKIVPLHRHAEIPLEAIQELIGDKETNVAFVGATYYYRGRFVEEGLAEVSINRDLKGEAYSIYINIDQHAPFDVPVAGVGDYSIPSEWIPFIRNGSSRPTRMGPTIPEEITTKKPGRLSSIFYGVMQLLKGEW